MEADSPTPAPPPATNAGETLPVLPVRAQALFPTTLAPLTVSRPASLRALEAAGVGKRILIVAQRDPSNDAPRAADLHSVGTVGSILRVAKMSQDPATDVAFVQGVERVRILSEVQHEPYLTVRVEPLAEIAAPTDDLEVLALVRNVKEVFFELVHNSPTLPDDAAHVAVSIDDPSALADFVAYSAPFLSNELKQELLETLDVRARLRRLTESLVVAREEQKLKEKIRAAAADKITESQREFFLREQLKEIRAALGEEDEGQRTTAELRKKLDEITLPEEARKEADRELERLRTIPPASPEHALTRTYLEWIASLPWSQVAAKPVNLERAAAILDEDHYDLEKLKERILEHLAVLALKRDLKGPILCFVGPPGVGKTSVGKSIARATGRPFVRISLGGMRDEAEIRGHRRTYVGALPGQIIRGMRHAGASDPVFMLDEIDKLGHDFRGDPAAALLEVLDPEQNATFRDHYLDIPLDLSKVLFITTANVLDPVAPALRDRMETLELPGYIDEEKLQIARRYLIPKQSREHGIDAGTQLSFTDDAVCSIIHGYTHEAGVRGLERAIGAIFRKRARQIVGDGVSQLTVSPEVAREMLGVPHYRVETDLRERTRTPGVAVAVAWTPYGGDVLFVETARMARDRGEFVVTGQVKEVMQESAKAALSWLRAHADAYGIDPDLFLRSDLHIHIPSGAVPKDGPSAGIVMVAALVSLLTGRPVRPLVAMTGEITLSGRILPVGGIREKVLAAKRCGVRELVLPAHNEAEVLEDVAPHLREGLAFHFVDRVADALAFMFDAPTDAAVTSPPVTAAPDTGIRADTHAS